MWFKNLRIYRLTDLLPCPVDELGERLLATSFVPCGGLDTQRSGWVSPMGPTATHLVHSAANFHLVCARTQQRRSLSISNHPSSCRKCCSASLACP